MNYYCPSLGDFDILVAPANIDIVDGGVYYIPCVAYSRSGRPITITWEDTSGSTILSHSSRRDVFETNSTTGGVYVAKSILEISCASFEDAMQYTCVASDGFEHRIAGFNVRYTCELTTLLFLSFASECTLPPSLPPSLLPSKHYIIHTVGPIIMSPTEDEKKDYEKRESESVSFSCIISAQPSPDITWLKDGKPLSEQKDPAEYDIDVTTVPGSEVAVNSTLVLFALTSEDSGRYSCRGENTLAEVELAGEYRLSVIGQTTPGKEIIKYMYLLANIQLCNCLRL